MRQRLFGDLETMAIFFGMIGLTIVVASAFKFWVNRSLNRKIKNLQADPTNYQFLKHFVTAVIYLVGIGWAFLVLPTFKTVAHTLLTGAGIAALIAGLAAQQALSNITSGLFIVIFKPFRLNDRITIRDKMSGTVEDITLRHTILRDLENNRIVIPNAVMGSEIIINKHLSDQKVCRKIDIGVSYRSDINKALEIMKEEVSANHLSIKSDRGIQSQGVEGEVFTQVLSLSESSVILRVWAWAKSENDAITMEGELLKSIKESFDRSDIEIPFPQRVVSIKNVP